MNGVSSFSGVPFLGSCYGVEIASLPPSKSVRSTRRCSSVRHVLVYGVPNVKAYLILSLGRCGSMKTDNI